MNLPFYIARRYLVSKKSHNIINIISWISLVGVAIGSMALIVVLSVFNGFERLVVSLFNTFNPDLLITAKSGKTFDIHSLPMEELRKIPGVISITEVIEENALMKYRDRQYIVTLKGVSDDYMLGRHLDSLIVEGHAIIRDGKTNFAIPGYSIAYYLGLSLSDVTNPINVYVPRRASLGFADPASAFNTGRIFPSGYFSVQQDFDSKYVIVPLRFAQQLLEYDTQRTGVEILLNPDMSLDLAKQTVVRLTGGRFTVKNRLEQQELLYKIMKSEKWAIFLILTFILLIATFNVIGSLSMLIIDKKKDVGVFLSMGADLKTIKRIFRYEGMMISTGGAIAGLILGAGVCFLQQYFGLIKLGTGDNFVVNTYPVHMALIDFLLVFGTVLGIGYLASWYPVRGISRLASSIPGKED